MLHRRGSILAAQGNYALNPSSHYFILTCDQAFISTASAQSLINRWHKKTNNLILLEGPLSDGERMALTQAGNSRSYLFKLSDYNNSSPAQRNQDLKQLGHSVANVHNRYKTEAFIRIDDAYGIERPDELVVIYYESMAAAEAFREKNTEVLESIGRFNQQHLTQYSYLIADSIL